MSGLHSNPMRSSADAILKVTPQKPRSHGNLMHPVAPAIFDMAWSGTTFSQSPCQPPGVHQYLTMELDPLRNWDCVWRRRNRPGAAGPDSLDPEQPEGAAGSQGSSIYLIGIVVLATNTVILALVALRFYRKENSGYRYQKLPDL